MHKDSFTQALRAHHAIILILRVFLFFFKIATYLFNRQLQRDR